MLRQVFALGLWSLLAVACGGGSPSEVSQHCTTDSSPFDVWLDQQCPGGPGLRVADSDGRSFEFACNGMRQAGAVDANAREQLNRAYAALVPETSETGTAGEAQQKFLTPIGAAFCGLFTLGFGLLMSRGVCNYPGADRPEACRDVSDGASIAFTLACIAPW